MDEKLGGIDLGIYRTNCIVHFRELEVEPREGMDTKEDLSNHASIVCGYSLVTVSCSIAICLITRAILNSELLVPLIPLHETRNLYQKVALKLVFILCTLNMTIAFVVFTAQSKTFRKSLVSIFVFKSIKTLSINKNNDEKHQNASKREEKQLQEFNAQLQILSRKIIQSRLGSGCQTKPTHSGLNLPPVYKITWVAGQPKFETSLQPHSDNTSKDPCEAEKGAEKAMYLDEEMIMRLASRFSIPDEPIT